VENARILRGVLRGDPGAARDVVILNAGAALWACRRAATLEEGVSIATAAIDSGGAQDVLRRYLSFTRRHGGKR
jgi:anthranilate phosphoribosyltransferase